MDEMRLFDYEPQPEGPQRHRLQLTVCVWLDAVSDSATCGWEVHETVTGNVVASSWSAPAVPLRHVELDAALALQIGLDEALHSLDLWSM